MRRMLFFDGRNAKRAWPVLGEYIRPNVFREIMRHKRGKTPAMGTNRQLRAGKCRNSKVIRRLAVALAFPPAWSVLA
jgi:hypothetical protein